LLVHDQPGVILEVKGKFKIYDPNTNERVGAGFEGKRRFIQAVQDGIRWGEEFPGVHQIAIIPDNPSTTILVGGIEYQGTIYVYDVGGSISVVNKIDVENYLKSVLPHRYPDLLQGELLAAISIAARTNSYYNLQNSKTAFWDVDAQDEGYHGYALGADAKAFGAALDKTKYIAMQDGSEPTEKALFAASWRLAPSDKRYRGITYSAITITDADNMAKAGANAASILKKAFPQASLQLMYPPAG
jgi:stage II sporulation protein D